MLSRSGRVEQIRDGQLSIRIESVERCVGCAQACAVHSFARVFGRWPLTAIRVPSSGDAPLEAGMAVRLELQSRGLLLGAGAGFALPLVGLVAGTAIAGWSLAGSAEGGAISQVLGEMSGAVAGLAAGVAAARILARRYRRAWSIRLSH